MEKLKKVLKKRPFLYSWIIFFLLSIYFETQNIGGDIAGFSNLILIFIPYFYIYIFKPYLFIKDKRKFSVKFHEADKWTWSIIIVFSIGMPGVGFIAYNGMVQSAKDHATKSNHAQTVKYISAEIQKCSLGETNAMDGNLTCSELNATNVVDAATKTLTDKNPYSPKNNAARISTSNTLKKDVGYINLSVSGSVVVVKSCHKKPCSDKNNRIPKTIIEIK